MEMQKLLFDEIKNKLPFNTRLVDAVSEAINISTDAAYHRISLKKELSFTEASKLCRYFTISFDSLSNDKQADNIQFKYTSLDSSDLERFYSYKRGLVTTFETIAKAADNNLLFLGVADVPIFRLTPFKELSLFKDFTWFQNVSRKETYEQFVERLDAARILENFDRITKAWLQIPSIEIWTSDTLNPILNLLEYYVALNSFENKQEMINILFNQLLELVEEVEVNAERGWKEYNNKKTPCRLYISKLSMLTDFVIAKSAGIKTGMIKLHTINGLFTDNQFFTSEIEKWLTDMQSKSLSITGASALERLQFFKDLKDKIYNLKKKVGRKK